MPLATVTFSLVQTTKEEEGDMWRVTDYETTNNHQREVEDDTATNQRSPGYCAGHTADRHYVSCLGGQPKRKCLS